MAKFVKKVVAPVVVPALTEDEEAMVAQSEAVLEEIRPKLAATANNLDGIKEIAAAIVGAVADLGPRRFIQYGRHDCRTVFNPLGKRNRAFDRPTFQNGFRCNVDTVTQQELELLPKLKQGLYIDRLVTVIVIDDVEGGQRHINYKNKTADQRMAIGSRITGAPGAETGFASLLLKIIAEQEANVARAKAQRKQEIEDALRDD